MQLNIRYCALLVGGSIVSSCGGDYNSNDAATGSTGLDNRVQLFDNQSVCKKIPDSPLYILLPIQLEEATQTPTHTLNTAAHQNSHLIRLNMSTSLQTDRHMQDANSLLPRCWAAIRETEALREQIVSQFLAKGGKVPYSAIQPLPPADLDQALCKEGEECIAMQNQGKTVKNRISKGMVFPVLDRYTTLYKEAIGKPIDLTRCSPRDPLGMDSSLPSYPRHPPTEPSQWPKKRWLYKYHTEVRTAVVSKVPLNTKEKTRANTDNSILLRLLRSSGNTTLPCLRTSELSQTARGRKRYTSVVVRDRATLAANRNNEGLPQMGLGQAQNIAVSTEK